MRICISITCGKDLYGFIISLRGDVGPIKLAKFRPLLLKCLYKVMKVNFNKLMIYLFGNRIGGVMVSVLASSAVEPRSCQTKDYKIGVYSFSAKHAALRRKSKDRLVRNQDSVIRHVYSWTVVSVG